MTTTNFVNKHARRQMSTLCHTEYSRGCVVAHEEVSRLCWTIIRRWIIIAQWSAAGQRTPQLSRLGPHNLSTVNVTKSRDITYNHLTSKSQLHHTQPFNVKVIKTPLTTSQRLSHSDITYNHSTSKSQRHNIQPFNVKVTATPHAIIERQSHSNTTCNH